MATTEGGPELLTALSRRHNRGKPKEHLDRKGQRIVALALPLAVSMLLRDFSFPAGSYNAFTKACNCT
jgi:hypothetical protein